MREAILEEREKTHGKFAVTAQIAQKLKSVIINSNRSTSNQQEEALDMICSKIARILSGNPNIKDHWADIAGYAKLGEEACE